MIVKSWLCFKQVSSWFIYLSKEAIKTRTLPGTLFFVTNYVVLCPAIDVCKGFWNVFGFSQLFLGFGLARVNCDVKRLYMILCLS